MKSYILSIGWLYPDLMSTYGDRGNVIVLQKRCEWRKIKAKVIPVHVETNPKMLESCDLLFMGGAQDTQQEIVNKDLFDKKGALLTKKIESGTPGLFICGAYQFLGKYYKTGGGTVLPGLSLFPIYTEHPGTDVKRLIGNIIIQSKVSNINLVGFENHGGRTYLDDPSLALAKVLEGYGNNGKDKTEGILYKNAIGTYLHGPILPKNPEVADFLIQKALEKKYGNEAELQPLENALEKQAREIIVKRYLS